MKIEKPYGGDLLAPVIDKRSELQPIPTDLQPVLAEISDIRAVIFDIYGTLLVSGSGDVGSADENDRGDQISVAIKQVWGRHPQQIPTVEELHQQVKTSNQSRMSDSCPKPEVDIVEIWRKTLKESQCEDLADDIPSVVSLAATYEALANPTWPMPGASKLLHQLSDAEMRLGIVSNAQVFTVRLVEDLISDRFVDSPFEMDLCVFSNRFRQAKPGPRLFANLVQALGRKDISPEQAIYVGNDMLNDVWAAQQAGLKTAWFAGDQRSCRPRSDDKRCQGLKPDLIITNLMQLPNCLKIR